MNKNRKKFLIILFLAVFTFVTLSGTVFAAESGESSITNGGVASCSGGSLCGGVCVPTSIINIIRTIVTIIKIGVPIILVVLGMIDMGKAVASQKEDEIKKGQKILISRCIAAGIVFFVVAIVKLLVNIIDTDDNGNSGKPTECLKEIFK